MGTTKDEIRSWLKGLLILDGTIEDHSHMLVVCDGFDYEDYPVYVKRTEDVQEKIDEFQAQEMQRVIEVYNLDMDIEEQLAVERAWNLEVK